MLQEGIESLFNELIQGFAFYIVVILALVQAIKEVFELEGKINIAISFAVGLLLGGLYLVQYFYPAQGDLVAGIFFVLTIGLVASGFYSIGTRIRDGDQ